MTNEFHHVTVLLHETVDMLDIKPDGIYVDATLGGAGHSSYLLSQLSEKGHLYCFDQDQKAIDNAQVRLKDYIDKGMVTFINDLVRIFFKYGEDKFSKQIARKIEQARQVKPIETTTELAEIIKSAKPAKELKKKGHPAKQIFQAIRIEVNDELGAADESIQEALDLLAVDGRISVITFHSLEDRLTKQLFKEASTVDVPKKIRK